MSKIGIIGGGINGLFISWQLSLQGFHVELFESDKSRFRNRPVQLLQSYFMEVLDILSKDILD